MTSDKFERFLAARAEAANKWTGKFTSLHNHTVYTYKPVFIFPYR
jgi:hypothetical protein